MRCVFCGGPLRSGTVTFSYDDEEAYVLVEHVPADVCAHCGEKVYSPAVADMLMEIAQKKTEPVKMLHIPVYDFTQAKRA
ncbi:MAG: YgiT-type zinc finger domain-containing protein [Candidatus Electronema aureum]|uniref:YgiT-type zinc finger domain-containing protein n=1 Tax=Candidatus Electronema aureum TaxID=2005002 RepID=A0A521G3H5_9BACT|nr:MAG: YgiT-type zinc finger domain-containing protein [Candidatus Electronema aureum]